MQVNSPVDHEERDKSRTPLRLLILEDRPVDAELMVAQLRRHGYQPEWTVVDTEEGFTAALDQQLDVILSDFDLPTFDGLAALAQVQRSALTVPVIVVSGNLGEETAAKCMREGAVDYLLKDRLGRLGAAVERAVQLRQLADERRQVESALIESQSELAAMFDNAPVAMFVLDPDRRIIRANRVAMRIVGRESVDPFGRRCGDAFRCLNAVGEPGGCGSGSACNECTLRRVVTDAIERGTSYNGVECEMWFEGAEGDESWTLLVSASPIKSSRGSLVVVALEDISERKRSADREHKLNRLLTTLRQINELIVREKSRDRLLSETCRITVDDGEFTMAWIGLSDEETLEVLPVAVAGNEAGFLADSKVRFDLSRDGQAPAGIAIREARTVVVNDIAGDRSIAPWHNAALARGYGSLISLPLQVNGRPFGVYTVFADHKGAFDEEIVELLQELSGDLVFALGALETAGLRTEAEQALGDSEARYRTLFEQSPTGIYCSTPDGVIVAANPALLGVLGFDSVEQLAEADSEPVLHPSQEDRHAFHKRVDEEGTITGHISNWHARDGRILTVRENTRAVRDSRGSLVAFEGTVEDITEHTRLEEQLRHSQKLEAMGRLAGGVAHDFNNLLQAMLATLECLRLEGGEAVAATDEMAEQVQRGASLARQLLLFARRGVTQTEPLDLNEVIGSSARLLRRVLPANVSIELALEEGSVPIDADRGQIEQVLTNLVLNAGEAMPEGGSVVLGSWTRAAEVGFEVKDTGTGMSKEVRDRVFEPYFTTKGDSGNGIGLPVVHGIVTQHAGTIEVDSTPGVGTCFRVALPRLEGQTPVAAKTESPDDAPELGRGERVLVVEDNEQIRALFEKMLEELGYRSSTFSCAEEALKEVDGSRFDLLISDVMLPGMNGAELARRLCARWDGLPVILMSGYAEDDVLCRDSSSVQARFLQKPITMAALAREIRAALDG